LFFGEHVSPFLFLSLTSGFWLLEKTEHRRQMTDENRKVGQPSAAAFSWLAQRPALLLASSQKLSAISQKQTTSGEKQNY